MKNFKILLVVTTLGFGLMFSSCHSTQKELDDLKFYTIEFDGCEYILSKAPCGDYGWIMSHKGNCKYCAKRNKK